MNAKYAYWSVATGEHGALMEECVRTARQAGVFRPFQVLTDRPLAGCDCYDACQCDMADGLFKLHYMKAGMSRLNFDYFVWLDADTVFARNPVDVLAPLGRSPIHVPLETDLSGWAVDQEFKGLSCFRLRGLFQAEGLKKPFYLSRSAFWIVHREAIEPVYDLAMGFWHRATQEGLKAGVDAALAYAMQILCADTEAHLLGRHPEVWGNNGGGPLLPACNEKAPSGEGRTPQGSSAPAIIHLGRRGHSPLLAPP